jgi:ketosteroid isomerase-like protein
VLRLALCVALLGCAPPAETPTEALAAYRQSILTMNVDATVERLEPDAQIHHADNPPIVGREAIRAFLLTFSKYHVTAYRLDADKTNVTGATATQHGTYHEDVTGPDGKPIHVDGVFDASWQRDADGRWRIARMHTNSPQ